MQDLERARCRRRLEKENFSCRFLKLKANLALLGIARRVKQGEHNVPRSDVIKRFTRSQYNFETSYRLVAPRWSSYDNSATKPKLLDQGP